MMKIFKKKNPQSSLLKKEINIEIGLRVIKISLIHIIICSGVRPFYWRSKLGTLYIGSGSVVLVYILHFILSTRETVVVVT